MRPEQIDNYFRMLEKEQWTFVRYRQDETGDWWLARRTISGGRIHVYLSIAYGCLLWQIPLAFQLLPACREALSRYLLQLNYELKLAKFSLDTHDQVHLTAEALLTGCNFSVFQGVLTALQIYFEHYRREIELIATSPELAQAWLSLSPLSEEPVITVIKS